MSCGAEMDGTVFAGVVGAVVGGVAFVGVDGAEAVLATVSSVGVGVVAALAVADATAI